VCFVSDLTVFVMGFKALSHLYFRDWIVADWVRQKDLNTRVSFCEKHSVHIESTHPKQVDSPAVC
jgi:hypothetical protein